MRAKPSAPNSEEAPLFREFEHTGDLGIELAATSRSELFRRAAVALASIMVDTAGVAAAERREITVDAETDTDLMHDLLAELLGLFTAEGFIWSEATVEEAGRPIRVTLSGEQFDPKRHVLRGEIKAVTYHQLIVEGACAGWRARIIFDV